MAKRGKRVLVIDNDQQGSLTTSMGNGSTQISTTLANLIFTAIDYPSELDACLERYIIHGDEMDLIPANQKLAEAVTRLVIMQTSEPMFVEDAEIKSEFVLRNIINHLRARYDYILIDCGWTPDLLMVNALAAADSALILVQARYPDSDALPQTKECPLPHITKKTLGQLWDLAQTSVNQKTRSLRPRLRLSIKSTAFV